MAPRRSGRHNKGQSAAQRKATTKKTDELAKKKTAAGAKKAEAQKKKKGEKIVEQGVADDGGDEEEGSDEGENEIVMTGARKVPFDFDNIKLEKTVALKIIMDDKFPKLTGPANYAVWLRKFENAMSLAGYQGFINGTYDEAKKTNPVWYKIGADQARILIEQSCTDEKTLEILNVKDPVKAYKTLQESSKPVGNALYQSLTKEFQLCTMASCGSARVFKAEILRINQELLQLDPKYAKPVWELNSHFINNLTSAFDHKVSANASDPKVMATDSTGLSFDELTRSIIEEESRLFNQIGDAPAVVAAAQASTASKDNAILIAECTKLDKQAKDVQRSLYCTRCKKKGHADVADKGGCWLRP
jgi:hypothetical protein